MEPLAFNPDAPLVNRVAESDIDVLDLAAVIGEAPVTALDLAPWLHRGFVLREKEFRAHVAAFDAAPLAGHVVALTCSTDAIVPTWAWMLVATRLEAAGVRHVTVGTEAEARREAAAVALATFDATPYADRIVVVKGCGGAVPPGAYAAAMRRLMGVARKVMYGEPCSSVPLWRRPKAASAADAPAAARPAALPR